MYINAQSPAVLTLAAPAEITMPRAGESQPLKLQPYQIVRATVAEGGLDKVVLNFKQHQFSAETKVPLRTGQKLHLQVVSTHPQVHLRIMEAAELKHLFRTLHSLGERVDLLQQLHRMHSMFGGKGAEGLFSEMQAVLDGLIRLLRSNPREISGRDLARLWGDLGLNLEALLAENKGEPARYSLKSAMYMLSDELQKKGVASEAFEKLHEQFTLFQLCRHRMTRENAIFLPLPFPYLEHGYLVAEKENRQDASEDETNRVWKMTMNLRLSRLGNLQVNLLFEDRNLFLRMLCNSDEQAGILAGTLPRLREKLTTVSLCSFSTGAGAEDPISALVRRLVPEGDHFLEVEA